MIVRTKRYNWPDTSPNSDVRCHRDWGLTYPPDFCWRRSPWGVSGTKNNNFIVTISDWDTSLCLHTPKPIRTGTRRVLYWMGGKSRERNKMKLNVYLCVFIYTRQEKKSSWLYHWPRETVGNGDINIVFMSSNIVPEVFIGNFQFINLSSSPRSYRKERSLFWNGTRQILRRLFWRHFPSRHGGRDKVRSVPRPTSVPFLPTVHSISPGPGVSSSDDSYNQHWVSGSVTEGKNHYLPLGGSYWDSWRLELDRSCSVGLRVETSLDPSHVRRPRRHPNVPHETLGDATPHTPTLPDRCTVLPSSFKFPSFQHPFSEFSWSGWCSEVSHDSRTPTSFRITVVSKKRCNCYFSVSSLSKTTWTPVCQVTLHPSLRSRTPDRSYGFLESALCVLCVPFVCRQCRLRVCPVVVRTSIYTTRGLSFSSRSNQNVPDPLRTRHFCLT